MKLLHLHLHLECHGAQLMHWINLDDNWHALYMRHDKKMPIPKDVEVVKPELVKVICNYLGIIVPDEVQAQL